MAADAAEQVVRDLAHDEAVSAGVELLDVQLKGAGGRRLVRVVIDRKGGVTLGTCQALSRGLSARLDAADPIGGRYSLEVTSPGTDWPLTDQRAFDRVEGREVLVHRRGSDGRVDQLRGRVSHADTDAVELVTSDRRITIPYRVIVKASQVLPW